MRFGHFSTIVGYEVVPVIGNSFSTHSFSMQHEPFAHTGVLGIWTPGEQTIVYAGVTNGWGNYADAVPVRGPWAITSTSYPGDYAGGFAGNFWEMTWGLNDRANRNWLIRPELRYDWFSPSAGVTALPYGQGLGQGIGTSGNQLGQLSRGCDVILQF